MRCSLLLSLLVVGTSIGTDVVQAQGVDALPARADTTFTSGPTWRHRILTALGGATLGAGLGYFGSQLSRSDWDEHPGVSTANRGLWASVGGGIGLTVGLAFPLHGPAHPTTLAPPQLGRRAIIATDEIEEVAANNVYDVVRILRPEWLVPRKADVFGDNASQTLPVYLDDFLYGGIESLRGLAVQDVESIRLLSTSAATARWGVGHNNGAIQVVTTGDHP